MLGGRNHLLLQGKTGPLQVPKLVEFRESIPKSAVGKILRKVLREEEEAKAKQRQQERN